MAELIRSVSPVEVVQPTTSQPTAVIGGVPMSMVEYFDLDYRNLEARDKTQINEIYDYFAKQDKPLEVIWSELRDIERRRGVASNEPRHSRVWRFVKLSNQIRSLQQQRDTL